MWLFLLIAIGLIGGIVVSVFGAGVIGIPLIVIGVIAAAVKVFGGAARQSAPKPATGRAMSSTGRTIGTGTDVPQDTDHKPQGEADTGFAHRGQEHMTG